MIISKGRKQGRIRAIKEPHEGYDELEAIPHSFAVEFKDGEGPWSMFCDTAEDKVSIVLFISLSRRTIPGANDSLNRTFS